MHRGWDTGKSEPPAESDPQLDEVESGAARRRVQRPGALARLLGADQSRSKGDRTPIRGLVMLSLGLLLALSAAVADAYLHRGIETSSEPPYVIQVSGRGLATNIDLRTYPEEQIEAVAATIRANGFQYVRHPFVWSEVESQEGTFAWDQYDAIVRSFSDAGVEMVAVIYGTPAWARSPEQVSTFDAPPLDPDQFSAFVSTLVERYGQYIRFYQIGDQPNDPAHWGGEQATAANYLAVLAPAFNAVRTANQEAKVILAEFAPRGGSGVLGDDLKFLDAVYDAGGAPYFDVVAAQVNGGARLTVRPQNERFNAQSLPVDPLPRNGPRTWRRSETDLVHSLRLGWRQHGFSLNTG